MAKRFKFRLDGLHKFRRLKTNEAKLALGEIISQKMLLERQIDEKRSYAHKLVIGKSTMKAMELQANLAHIDSIRHEIANLESKLKELAALEAERRDQLMNTMRDEKVMDNLHDKKLSEHHDTILREEQAVLDEIALRTRTKS